MYRAFERLQLRHFRLIHAIAELGQLSHAADRLGITQPGASRTLSEIEQQVGRPVFDRHPKGMTPTRIGEVMARHAGVLLSGLEQAAGEMEAFRLGHSGTVRVGAVTGAAVGYVVPAIQELRGDAQNPEIRLDVAPSVDLVAGLLSGEYDFVLSRVPRHVNARDLEVLYGREEHLDILVHRTHPLLRQRKIGIAALGSYLWVVQARGMPIREAVELAHHAAGVPSPRDVVDSASLLTTIAFLKSSDAVSPVAREVSQLLRGSDADDLAVLDMDNTITLPPYHLLQLRGRPLNPVSQRLRDIVLERFSVQSAQ